MGANCPSAVPALLHGCISVYCGAFGGKSPAIVAVSVQAVRELANLSPREAHRALAMINRFRRSQSSSFGFMIELQLELSMKHDWIAACYILIYPYSFGKGTADTHFGKDFTNSVDEVRAKGGYMAWKSESFGNDLSEQKPNSILSHLEENLELFDQTLIFLADSLDPDSMLSSRAVIYLRAYTSVITFASLNSLAHKSALSYQRISARVETCFGVLLNARNRLCRDNENVREAVVGQRFTDTLNELLLVSMISTINALVSINSFDKSETTENHAVKCLRELLAFDGNQFPSTRILQAKIAFSIHYLDAEWLYRTIESSLLNFNRMCPSTSFVVLFSSAITKSTWVKFLEWASIKKVIQLTATNAISVYKWKNVADPSFSTQLMQSEKVPNDIKTAIADTLLTKVVSDASTATNFLRMGSIVVDFIGLRCALSAGESGEGLPLIMPIQITEFSSVSSCCGSWWYQKPQFFIQLLYCFAFLEANKLSPFIFDPRTLPLKQIYSSCSDPSATSLNASVANILKDFIDRYCPEVRRTQQFIRLPSRRGVLFQNERASEKTECLYNLRKFISDHVADPCGDHAERAFVVASSRYCEADVCSMTASALLSRPHSLSPFFTYSMLYCDPLVLLKAPLHVWNRRGTRRIALHVFTSLLDINEACVRHNSTHDDVADELLKSRDGIILMTFIGILFSKSMLEQTMSSRCGMAIALIRKIVARCAGLVALLIKQGLSESELDWLIVAVPEVFDSVALKNILSDRSSLTASERLMAADGILRISIAHGYKSASDSETLTYLALAQLLSCFFLIVGPVGVPVNALISESTGLDATQVSRKAAFRILSALQSIRWYNKRLTNESVMTLQKFAGMCKGESIVGSLPAGIAAKQKTILKELLEAIAKALDATTG